MKYIASKSFLLILAFGILPVLPSHAQEDIVDRLDKALGVALPGEYQSKLKAFVQSNRVFKDDDASALTEQFIKDEMKKDWGISKQSQLLFIWTALNEKINGEYLYEGSDGDESRLEEFYSIMNTYDECGNRYATAFRARMKEISAEAKQRSAEADQRMMVMAYYGLYQMMSFYQIRGVAYESEIKEAKEYGKYVANNCEEFSIDYRSLLPLEVQKFYDIQPTKQNNLSCEQAIALTLNCTLKELAKLYNLYQQAPQAEREIPNRKNYIEDCKKNNVDYKAILLKELGDKKKVEDLLKFFGVE